MVEPLPRPSWRERARRVREGEPGLADQPVGEPTEALEDLFATILRRSFDAVVLCTREGEYLEVSDSFCALTGYDRAELLGQTSVSLGLVDPEGRRRQMEAKVDERVSDVSDNVIVRKDGTPRVVEFTQQYLEVDELTLVVVRDVTERRLREQELDRISREDPLTGVLNRRGFGDCVTSVLEEARLGQRTVHLVLADVDGLKSINDDLGHAFGDRALVAVAGALRQAYGPEAHVGRLGGDEFAVVVPTASAAEVAAAGAALQDFLARVVIGPAGAGRPVSVSLGVASASGGVGTWERLVAIADGHQYVAKRAHHATREDASGDGPRSRSGGSDPSGAPGAPDHRQLERQPHE